MESTTRFENKLSQFEQILSNFSSSINIKLDQREPLEIDLIKNGQIQKFEYTLESFWKLSKVYLYDIHGVDCNSPKSCVKALFQNTKMFENDYEFLIFMVNCRNSLSHIYDEGTFNDIYQELHNFALVFKRVVELFK